MVCLACAAPASGQLCLGCQSSMRPAPALSSGGLLIRGGARHEGAARLLVHRLKYRGVLAAAEPLAELMVPLIPVWAAALVPVPRSLTRRLRYGVDPSCELVRALGRLTGLPSLSALRAPLWWPRHAGSRRADRGAVGFRGVVRPSPSVVLIDDVVTSGSTLLSGWRAMQGIPTLAVTATVAGRVTSGSEPSPIGR